LNAPEPDDGRMTITIFDDTSAFSARARSWTFDELVEHLRGAQEYPSKADCPLIKLARFGELRTDKGSLRWDGNVIEITGLEGDYDAEQMPITEAAMLLHENGVEAVLYTSPSHTPEKPRWRVLAPLAHECPPQGRKRLLARLNGALGGVLAPESFTLSQSYYVGRVNGAAYDVQQVRGRRIDLLDELDERAIYSDAAAAAGDTRAERLDDIRSANPVIQRLAKWGLIKRQRTDGGVDITCPFADEHTMPGGAGDTTYWPSNTGGFARGHFKCLHSHCAARADEQYLTAIGLQPATAEAKGKARKQPNGEDRSTGWPEPLDLTALAKSDPEPPAFIIDDWLPCGYATLLSGHGGVGKSLIALYLAVCIAAGVSFFGLEVQRRRVLYLSCEDREAVLHWRLARICAHLGVDLASLRGLLDVLDLVGHSSVLWEKDPRTGHALTAAHGYLCERIAAQRTHVLVGDGIADLFGGNENNRGEVKQFNNALLAPIPVDGAVLLLGHVPKPAVAGIGEGYSGSTQWHNAARGRWYLYPETTQGEDGERQRTGELILELQKSNLGQDNQSMRFAWDEQAHLFLGGEVIGATAFDRQHRDRVERAAILRTIKSCADNKPPIIVPAAMQGQRTALNTLRERAEWPATLTQTKAASARFRRLLEVLRQDGLVVEQGYTRPNRHQSVQLVLTSEGVRQCAAY
jgi:RecA-family ATPase